MAFTGILCLLEDRVSKLAKDAVVVAASHETNAQELQKITAASQHRTKTCNEACSSIRWYSHSQRRALNSRKTLCE